MNAAVTKELFDALSELKVLFPDWRMGELVAKLATAAGRSDAAAIWDIEDEQLLSAARHLIDRNPAHEAKVTDQNGGLTAVPIKPQDEWERGVIGLARDCVISLPNSAVSCEGLYD